MNRAWHIGLAVLWILVFSYFRYRAARAEAPAEEDWFGRFLGMGWTKGTTVDGRRYRGYAIAALIIGACVFFFFPIHPCNG